MSDITCGNGNTHMNRVDIGITISESEVNNLKLIINKVSCCRQAASPDALPDGIDKDKAGIFIKAALEALGEAHALQEYWWSRLKQTYMLPLDKNIWVDFTTGELYTME